LDRLFLLQITVIPFEETLAKDNYQLSISRPSLFEIEIYLEPRRCQFVKLVNFFNFCILKSHNILKSIAVIVTIVNFKTNLYKILVFHTQEHLVVEKLQNSVAQSQQILNYLFDFANDLRYLQNPEYLEIYDKQKQNGYRQLH